MKARNWIPLLLLIIVAQYIYSTRQQAATRAVIQAQAAVIAAQTQDRDAITAHHQAEIETLRAELAAADANLNTVVQTFAIINQGGSTASNLSSIVVREPTQPAPMPTVTTFYMNTSNVIQAPTREPVQTSRLEQ